MDKINEKFPIKVNSIFGKKKNSLLKLTPTKYYKIVPNYIENHERKFQRFSIFQFHEHMKKEKGLYNLSIDKKIDDFIKNKGFKTRQNLKIKLLPINNRSSSLSEFSNRINQNNLELPKISSYKKFESKNLFDQNFEINNSKNNNSREKIKLKKINLIKNNSTNKLLSLSINNLYN
jgi:hypothetical protein